MDTERYQALMDTLEQIKVCAQDCRESVDWANGVSFRFSIGRMRRLVIKAADQADELFRAEWVEA